MFHCNRLTVDYKLIETFDIHLLNTPTGKMNENLR